jgi:Fe-S-cluster containining protein
MADFKNKFYDITGLIQREFDRNFELYGEKIQCRKGCSKCCSQIFRITLLDGWIIKQHIRSLPEEERNELQQKALQHEEGLPCPALGLQGECTIYDARPVICRRFGMPIYDYKNPSNVHACELTDTLLIPNQTEIGLRWDELKMEFGEGSTTIAEAIVKA